MEKQKFDNGDWPASVAANFLAGPEHDVIPGQREQVQMNVKEIIKQEEETKCSGTDVLK